MTRPDYKWTVEPDCGLGFTEAQMRAQLDDRYAAFEEYMLMKAQPICKGPASASPSDTCTVGHGMVFYTHDVAGFVERG